MAASLASTIPCVSSGQRPALEVPPAVSDSSADRMAWVSLADSLPSQSVAEPSPIAASSVDEAIERMQPPQPLEVWVQEYDPFKVDWMPHDWEQASSVMPSSDSFPLGISAVLA
eukprot:1479134-Rhodomonas_salina.1